MKSTIAKKTEGYGYKYTELADINKYCEERHIGYYQAVETSEINQKDYIVTTIVDDEGKELRKVRGCQIVEAVLQGIKNPVQEYGSSLTYCRRYSLLMALGLATEDDDGASFTQIKEATQESANQWTFSFGKYKGQTMSEVLDNDPDYMKWYINNKSNEYDRKCYELITGNNLPTEEEQDIRIQLMHEINELENTLDIDHEEVLNRLKVKSLNQLSNVQLQECVNNLKKVQK